MDYPFIMNRAYFLSVSPGRYWHEQSRNQRFKRRDDKDINTHLCFYVVSPQGEIKSFIQAASTYKKNSRLRNAQIKLVL